VLNAVLALVLVLPAAAGCRTATRDIDPRAVVEHGGIVRGDTLRQEIALVFTGDAYADGGWHIRETLRGADVPAGFFLTGNFYRNDAFRSLVSALGADGHYLGAHSDRHLLYAAWEDRDSTLVDADSFARDVLDNYREMARFGIGKEDAPLFLPPFEWYNGEIGEWTRDLGLHLVNYTRGTRSHADYTTPSMGAGYIPGDTVWRSIFEAERSDPNGLNGFILLMHVGTAAERTDKFHLRLGELIGRLRALGYTFVRIDDLVLRR
jgi:peptidoglycan/xylan/chitin deacetylase (PgdA/CDA1 family)